ncbi:MAG: MauE/DoxX family redox-associated membrane protein [Planctomycetota bacterium]
MTEETAPEAAPAGSAAATAASMGEASTRARDSRARSPLARLDDTGVPLLIARLVVGLVFVALALVKIADPHEFLGILKQFELIPLDPPILINLTVVILPWVELLVGGLLLAGLMVRASGAIVAVLLVVFMIAVYLRALGVQAEEGQALCRIAFDCGCGAGPIKVCRKLIENGGLLLLAFIPLFSRSRRFCLPAPSL